MNAKQENKNINFKDISTKVVGIFHIIGKSIFNFVKYICYGLVWPIVLIIVSISKLIISSREVNVEKLKKQGQKIYEKQKQKELKSKKKKPEAKKTDTTAYINDNIVIEKKSASNVINDFFKSLASIPASIKAKIDSISLVKKARNQKAFDTKTMLVDFSDEVPEEGEGKRIVWEYVAIDQKGKKVKGYFEAFSRLDVQSFLMGEGLAVYSIKTSKMIRTLHGGLGVSKSKIKTKDLIFMLTQLSTYIKSGIPLVESLNILIRQTPKKAYKSILRDVTYDLTVGENFSTSLEKRGAAFPRLLINMVRASELTGELPEALDDMVEYYTEAEATRKEMISALTYPSIVFLFTLAVVTFVMIYVVPKFVDIYASMDSNEIPKFTLTVINVSSFLEKNIIWVILGVVGVITVLVLLYKKVPVIRTMFQYVFMHLPVIKNVIIYNEVTMFSKTFASLLSHNVHITASMDILNKVTNNEFYKMMIMDTVANLASGDKISTAFKDQWAFPIPAYEMIVTGEKTGQLAEMMSKVSTYYQDLHKNTVSKIKALVEPILIVFLTFSVGIILLAIIIPMFNMYQQVQSLG